MSIKGFNSPAFVLKGFEMKEFYCIWIRTIKIHPKSGQNDYEMYGRPTPLLLNITEE